MFIRTLLISAITTILATSLIGCSGGEESFQTPSTSDTPINDGLIAQNNFTVLAAETRPQFVNSDLTGTTAVSTDISVTIGDNNNQVITSAHTIFFRTEWGLIDPSCETENGSCSVTWQSTSSDNMPTNFRNTIVAYSPNGQESFNDFNSNNRLNDGETFFDNEEPFVDVNENDTFDSGVDLVIDTINGNDTTGANGTHDIADGFFNGPDCSHSTVCSPTTSTHTVWGSNTLLLTGDISLTVGGTISGLVGTAIVSNNLFDSLNISTDGEFTFELSMTPGSIYNVTVASETSNCTISNGSGTTFLTNVADIIITCVAKP